MTAVAYADYEFYTDKYFGSVIAADDFPRMAERAGEKIDLMTFERLTDGLPSDERAANKVKKAVCAAAEVLYKIEQFGTQAEQAGGYETDEATGKLVGKIVSSKSAGNESISFSAGTSDFKNSSVIGAVMSDKRAQNQLVYDTVKEYLSGVTTDEGIPLLYAGI